MAESIQAPEDEQEYAQWLDDLESEEDKAVAVAEREDKQEQKVKQARSAEHDEETMVSRTEYLRDKFLATATDQEKAFFAISSRRVETPRELQDAIDLAKSNAMESEKLMGATVEERAEEKATEKARDAYGVGPITPGQASRKMTPQEEFDALAAQARENRDTHVSFKLWNALPGSGEVSQPD